MGDYDGSLKFDTEIDEKGFSEGLEDLNDKAKKSSEEIGSSLGKAGGKFERLGGLAKGGLAVLSSAIAGVSAALGAGVAAGLKYNASIESYQTSFEVMTGSAEKAAEVVERLKKIGADTPFELPELADTTQLLMNYGFTADEAMGKMMMLGDISQGSAEKMSRIAMAYGQMSSAGKVSLEDVKQMIEAGFNPLQEISESTGESMESLYDRISKGTISVDEITASMERATSEGGKYYQSMQKQSQTFNGLISTLADNAQQLLGDVVQPISDSMVSTLLPAAIDALTQMTDAFQTNGVDGLIQAGAQVLVNLLTGIAQSLPSVIETAVQIIQAIVNSLNANMPQIMSAGGQILLSLISGIATLLPSLAGLALNIISRLVSGLIANATQLMTQANTMFTDFCAQIQNRLPELLQRGAEMISNLLTGLLNNAPQIMQQASEMLLTYLDTILGMLPSILQSGADLILNLLFGLLRNAPKIISQSRTMLIDYIATIASHLPEILQKGIEIIGQLLAGILREVPSLIASIPGIVADIAGAFLDHDWLGIGWDIIAGIGRGIASAAGNLVDAAVSAAKDAVEAVKGWLGIHSPSRRMRDEVGKYMAIGMGIGFKKNIPTEDMSAELEGALVNMKNRTVRLTAKSPLTVGNVVRNVTNNYTGEDTNYAELKKVFLSALNDANKKPVVLNGRQIRRWAKEEGVVFE